MAQLQNENEALLAKAREERAQLLKEARETKEKIINEAKDVAKVEAGKSLLMPNKPSTPKNGGNYRSKERSG